MNSAAPRAINVNEIVDWIYPNGLSSREYKKVKTSIFNLLIRHLDKNLWIRVERGLYRAKTQENIKQSDSGLAAFKKESKILNQENIFKEIESLGGYKETVQLAIIALGNRPSSVYDIYNWLNPNLSKSLKKKIIESFQNSLSKLYNAGKLERVEKGFYILSNKNLEAREREQHTGAKIFNKNSEQLNSNLEENNDILKFKEYQSALKDLFEAEGKGVVLHYNYIGYKIFGTSHKEYNERLLEFLARGQKEKIWAQDPLDPNCWTKDLNLLPR